MFLSDKDTPDDNPLMALAGMLLFGNETEPETDKPELNTGACEKVFIPFIV